MNKMIRIKLFQYIFQTESQTPARAGQHEIRKYFRICTSFYLCTNILVLCKSKCLPLINAFTLGISMENLKSYLPRICRLKMNKMATVEQKIRMLH